MASVCVVEQVATRKRTPSAGPEQHASVVKEPEE